MFSCVLCGIIRPKRTLGNIAIVPGMRLRSNREGTGGTFDHLTRVRNSHYRRFLASPALLSERASAPLSREMLKIVTPPQ